MMIILSFVPSAILLLIQSICAKIKKDSVKPMLKMFGLVMVLMWITAEIGNFLNEKAFSFVDHTSMGFLFTNNYIFTALLEEVAKFLAFWLIIRKSKVFTHTVKGMIYSMTSAFGFVVFENFVYMMDDMAPIMLLYRGVLGGLGHMTYGILMGYFYGNAKYADATGDKDGNRKNLIKALLIPVALHGTYDFLIDLIQVRDSDLAFVLFFVFIIFDFVIAVKVARKAFRENREIPGVVEENTESTEIADSAESIDNAVAQDSDETAGDPEKTE